MELRWCSSHKPPSLIRVVLEGPRAVATDGAPTGPNAVHCLAAVRCRRGGGDHNIRNAWGNAASAVSAGEVANMRQTLHRQAQAPLAVNGVQSMITPIAI